METLEIVGEQNFRKICQAVGLTVEEENIVREIVVEWDKLVDADPFADKIERGDRKMGVFTQKTAKLDGPRRELSARALFQIRILFGKLSKRRQ